MECSELQLTFSLLFLCLIANTPPFIHGMDSTPAGRPLWDDLVALAAFNYSDSELHELLRQLGSGRADVDHTVGYIDNKFVRHTCYSLPHIEPRIWSDVVHGHDGIMHG